MDNAQLELSNGKPGVLLRKYAIPAIIAMTATSLYNIVDSIFIGRGVGPYALSGLAVTFPFMNLTTALGTLIGVGCSTLLSIKLGQKDHEAANRIFGNEVILNVIISLVYTCICLLFLDPILSFFGASENILPYARDYMFIILSGNVLSFMFQGLNHLLRASGHPRTAMTSMLATVLINVVLDFIFIFIFDWGIRGAALATVLSQSVALVWLGILYSDPKRILHFRKGMFRIDLSLIWNAVKIGLSPFFVNTISTLVVILVNRQLLEFGGELAIGAYGIINRVWFIFLMIILGLTQGMQPIIGFNYGAKRMDRALATLRIAVVTSLAILLLAAGVCMLFPVAITGVFTDNREMIDMASRGLRFMMMTMPALGIQMVIAIFFQSVGGPGKSIFLNLSRQVLILIPALYLLPEVSGMDGIWYSFNIADVSSCLLSVAMLSVFISRLSKSHR